MRVAGKTQKTKKRSPLPRVSHKFPALSEDNRRRKPWRLRARAEAFWPMIRAPLCPQWLESFGLSKSSSNGRTMVFASPSPVSIFCEDRFGDHVFLRGPIAQVAV